MARREGSTSRTVERKARRRERSVSRVVLVSVWRMPKPRRTEGEPMLKSADRASCLKPEVAAATTML